MISEILRPQTVEEALRLKARPGTAYLGGGTWLNSCASPEDITALISLERLGLNTIESSAGRCRIGASVTLQQIVDSAVVPAAIREAASLTASRTLRNMATMGGECAFRALDSALIPALLAMEAEIVFAETTVPAPAEDLWKEHADRLILSVTMPLGGRLGALKSLSRTSHSRRTVVIAVGAAEIAPQLRAVRIVASDCVGRPGRLRDVERALEGAPLPPKARIEELVTIGLAAQADIHASAEYKRYMAGVMAADLLYSLENGKASP
jgi:putative selenate reductase FAD-binding subunit